VRKQLFGQCANSKAGILARETRELRRAGTEPDVVAYLLPHPVHLIVINVVIANVGQGPARDVEVEFEADPSDFSSHNVRYPAGVKRRVAAVLPQGERYVQVFGAGEDLHKPTPLKDFTIRVHYTDSKSTVRHTSSLASIKEFEGWRIRPTRVRDGESAEAHRGEDRQVVLWN
jgi:hypothetical protein